MTVTPLPAWNEKLHELMQFFIEVTPPKTLGRLLRNFFLLNVSELKTVPSNLHEAFYNKNTNIRFAVQTSN